MPFPCSNCITSFSKCCGCNNDIRSYNISTGVKGFSYKIPQTWIYMNFLIKHQKQNAMSYFILFNARQSFRSEYKLKERWLSGMQKYKLTHGKSHTLGNLFKPPHPSNLTVSQNLSFKHMKMFINCRQSICLKGWKE